jgi:prophage antirepressor-like protein
VNELQIFNNPEFGQVRMVEIDEKPYAVGVDVARVLEYANPNKAILDHCKGDFLTWKVIDSLGREQETRIILEGDIYRLIVKAADQSRNPEIKTKAEKFERWIFDEVLPQIRKTGSYSAKSKSDPKIKAIEAEAKLRNSQARQGRLLANLAEKFQDKLSNPSIELLVGEAAQVTCGYPVLPKPKVEKSYSAEEIGNEIGISANMVGRIANTNDLKIEQYGMYVLDKSKSSLKQVETWRYNEAGKQRIIELQRS